MSNSAITPFWGILIGQLPLLLTYLVGMLIAIARLSRHPRPAAFVLIGCALLLACSVVGSLVQVWFFQNRSASVTSASQILMAVNLVLAFVRAGAFVLLIVAAFVARTEPEPSAFPVGHSVPSGPPMAQRYG